MTSLALHPRKRRGLLLVQAHGNYLKILDLTLNTASLFRALLSRHNRPNFLFFKHARG